MCLGPGFGDEAVEAGRSVKGEELRAVARDHEAVDRVAGEPDSRSGVGDVVFAVGLDLDAAVEDDEGLVVVCVAVMRLL